MPRNLVNRITSWVNQNCKTLQNLSHRNSDKNQDNKYLIQCSPSVIKVQDIDRKLFITNLILKAPSRLSFSIKFKSLLRKFDIYRVKQKILTKWKSHLPVKHDFNSDEMKYSRRKMLLRMLITLGNWWRERRLC